MHDAPTDRKGGSRPFDPAIDPARFTAALAELPVVLARLPADLVHEGTAAWLAKRLTPPPATLGALLATVDEVEVGRNFAILWLAKRSLAIEPSTLRVSAANPNAKPALVGDRHFHHGSIVVEGNLHVEKDLWVTGDLTVSGACSVMEYWIPVYVGGHVRARSVYATSDFVAGESLMVDEAIVSEEYSVITTGGLLKAKLLLESCIGGDIRAANLATAAPYHFTQEQMAQQSIATRERLEAVLAPELFREGAVVDEDDDVIRCVLRMVDALEAGRTIWRKLADAPAARPRLPPRLSKALKSGRATELDLSGSGLDALPPELGQLAQLKKLEIGSNMLAALPDALGALPALEELWCDDNQLTGLPASLARASSLRVIIACNNRIGALPDELGTLPIVNLNLQNNALDHVPRAVHGWSKLTRLNLRDNPLTTLDEQFGELATLTTLELGGRLAALPASFGRLSQLKFLYVFDGELAALPASFAELHALSDLSLIGQRLTHIPAELLALPSLKELTLHRNAIAALPADLSGWAQLETLSLSQNQLTSVPDALFALPCLGSIYLQDNAIPEADRPRLRALAKEHEIDIYLS